MSPTARFWYIAAASVGLAGLGVLAAQPIAVLGGVGLASWLLVSQVSAAREFESVVADLKVSIDPVRSTVMVGEDVAVTVSVTTATAERPVTAQIELPPGASTSDETTVTLPAGDDSVSTRLTCSFPVAGAFEFPPVTVSLENEQGTVTETIPIDPEVTMQVDPRRPRNIHVGQGGERVAAYGEHPAGSGASGLVPMEIRQYVAGDARDQIDWKATARLRSPHVREFETETDRKTVIVLDQRAVMGIGPDGEEMLDYAREVALGFARAAESSTDPLGLYTVGNAGITSQYRPTSSPGGYRAIRNRLYTVSPTGETSARWEHDHEHLSRPRDARTAADRLVTEDSPFADAVAPFFANTEAYVHRIDDDPLFEAVRRVLAETSGQRWLVVLTTDTDRNRLRDAASLVATGDDSLSVFLTPRVLFEPGAMDDLTDAYERYTSFESFRQAVNRTPRTEAYELGPGDRLDALLAARRRARQ